MTTPEPEPQAPQQFCALPAGWLVVQTNKWVNTFQDTDCWPAVAIRCGAGDISEAMIGSGHWLSLGMVQDETGRRCIELMTHKEFRRHRRTVQTLTTRLGNPDAPLRPTNALEAEQAGATPLARGLFRPHSMPDTLN